MTLEITPESRIGELTSLRRNVIDLFAVDNLVIATHDVRCLFNALLQARVAPDDAVHGAVWRRQCCCDVMINSLTVARVEIVSLRSAAAASASDATLRLLSPATAEQHVTWIPRVTSEHVTEMTTYRLRRTDWLIDTGDCVTIATCQDNVLNRAVSTLAQICHAGLSADTKRIRSMSPYYFSSIEAYEHKTPINFPLPCISEMHIFPSANSSAVNRSKANSSY